MAPRLLEKYRNEVSPKLAKEFGYKNVMQIPRLKKIVVNVGVGDAKLDIKFMDAAIAELGAITGQRPLLKRARKSVAGVAVCLAMSRSRGRRERSGAYPMSLQPSRMRPSRTPSSSISSRGALPKG